MYYSKIRYSNSATKIYHGIKWNDYLSNELLIINKKYNDNISTRIIEVLEKESFLYEQYYLSLIYYEYYSLFTNSKCLEKQDKIIDNFISISPKDMLNSSIQNIDITRRITLNESMDSGDIIEENYKRPRAFSLVFKKGNNCDNSDSSYNLEERKELNKLLNIIQNHINEDKHPFNILIQEFISLVINEISCIIEQYKTSKHFKNINNHYTLIIELIKVFILKFHSALKLFLAYTIDMRLFKEERDEGINLITSLIFKDNNKLYSNLYNLYKIIMKHELSTFKSLLSEKEFCTPTDLGIKQRFSLNEQTKKIQLDIIDKEINRLTKNIKENLNLTNKLHHLNHLKTQILNLNTNNPYSKVIEKLKDIKFEKVPYKKLIRIANLSKEIETSLNDFWKYTIKFLDVDELNIDSDTIMSIFIYITVKAKEPDLLIQLIFIDHFVTALSKNDMNGYYYSTLVASISYIKNINRSENLLNSSLLSVLKRNDYIEY